MKKSFLLFGLMLVCLFGLVGCDLMGGGTTTKDPDDEPIVEPTKTYNIKFYDGKKLLDEQNLEKGAEILFPTPTAKEGYYFAYWEEDGREFMLELMPASDVELKAHYEEGYTYTFICNNEVVKEGHGAPNSEVVAPTVPASYKEGNMLYTFAGWDKEVTKLTENVVYTATYTSKEVVTLTYVLDGGNFKYYSYDEVVADLLQDYNKYAGTSYTVSSIPMGAWECANVHAFFYATVSNQKMNEKWAWLATYLSQVGGSNNKAACAALNKCKSASEFAALNDNYKYSVSYEFRGFMTASKFDANQSFPSSNYETYDLQNGFWQIYQGTVVDVYNYETGKTVVPTNAKKQNYSFGGWYDNAGFNGSAITSIKLNSDVTLYAKWIELTPVSSIDVSNTITEIEKFKTHKFEWTISPADAGNKAVKFKSSDPSVLSVSATGVITAHANGTANIIITSVLTPSCQTIIPVEVYTPDHFEASYETESYTTAGNTIKLNAELVLRNGSKGEVTWESLDESVATVNAGIVTGVAAGSCAIRCANVDDSDSYFDFYVTVLPENISNELQQVINANNSNVVIQYEQGIGDPGSYAYYIDLIGSVSNIHFSPYIVDKTYYDVLASGQKNYGAMTKVEWICVHYTGNMSKGSDADNNANYFNNLGYAASIHYVTGATNLYRSDSNDYRAFAVLNEAYAGWHASTGSMETTWYATGVMVSPTDPERPVFSVSANSKFTINGKETSVSIPERDDGIKVTGPTFQYGGQTCNSINDMGLPYKVVDGQYYLGSTYWGSQQYGKTISSMGGNKNGIGIESCVDPGSDIIRTWHVTAQLVADLMYRYDLDITRVVGHHFFSGKNCPQPMLEHNMKLWYYFLEMVEAEYQVITTLADYDIEMTVLNGDACKANGRISQPLFAQSIQYQVTITNKNTHESQTIVLASLVEGQYSK